MRKLLNTLYITTDMYVNKDGTNIVLTKDHEEVFRIPVHNLEGVVCCGYMPMTPAVMRLCVENQVSVSFIDINGRFLARVSGGVKGNVLLRRTQYRVADDAVKSNEIARFILKAKFVNCRNVLRRGLSDHEDVADDLFKESIEKINSAIKSIDLCPSNDELRGVEGNTARIYFSAFDALILKQRQDFFMRERTRRPPLDNMNALLSFLYTMLANDVQSSLEMVGLDPYVGFLHTDRPGRASLALDIMEELRPFMADRLALNLVNLNMISGPGFDTNGMGVMMNDDTRKTVINAWQKRKQETITHPYIHEKIEIGLIPYVQALLMSRYLRGDIGGYPPFFST
ncbi:MAG: type I-C CRISPR-associated endonuclease Cas1c [Methanomassiliicoccales archaeon]|nr:type I-C CRISPR-associated endonuclease Cas1c [Methanomassiliicoccales archaeon]